MKTRRSIPALGAFFVLIALAVSACGSSVPDGSVAVVAGNPISHKAVNHWMFVLAKQQVSQSAPGQPVIVPNDPPRFSKCVKQVRVQIPALKNTKDAQIRADCKQLFTTLSGQVMDFLIRAYWYQAEAHKQHIHVTDAQVQQALATAKKSGFSTAAQFQNLLTTTGQTLADVTYRIRVQTIYSKLLAKHPTTVTPAQVASYYAAHKSSFGSPQTRDMRVVLTKTAAAAAAARKALDHGQSFAKVAKKYSIDPTTKSKGGLLTGVSAGQQDTALSTAAFGPSAKVGKLVGPIKGQFGYYVLEVTKITPAKSETLAQATKAITTDADHETADGRPDRGQRECQEALAEQDAVQFAVRHGRLQRLQGTQDEHRRRVRLQRHSLGDGSGRRARSGGDHSPRRDHPTPAPRLPVGSGAG